MGLLHDESYSQYLILDITISSSACRYPESMWCMDELVKMKTLADKKDLIIIPIFYKVEAEDVSNLKGEFGENFYKLAKANPDRMTKWKDALEGICNYMGMLLPDRSSEADFVKDIVKEVKRVLEAIRLKEKENNSGKHLKKKGNQVTLGTIFRLSFS
ncbi:hypothetical protein N665_1210s0012 [Sinapis alba]|nr:hypothetical protein N665_1210s0012 [Sinapis alba]